MQQQKPPPPADDDNSTTSLLPARQRYYLFSFQGRGGFRRDRLALLDNGGDVYVRLRDTNTYWGKSGDLYDYAEVMRSSIFAAAPKGDCLYSYRFAEIMSAGAIPVVYANDWLPPFSSKVDPDRVIDWGKCAIFLKEAQMKKTITVLRNISEEVRCEMQQCALAFWDEFGSSRDGWLRALLQWVNRDPVIVGSGNTRL